MKFKFPYKFRSLPNSNTIQEYFDLTIYIAGFWFVYNFIYICVFSSGFSPEFPAWFLVAVPVIYLRKYYQIENRKSTITTDDFKDLIIDLRQKQFQVFREKLEDRPEFLSTKYKGHSLLYWCKKYNDKNANRIAIESIKKLADSRKISTY
jgi:hypothetical protein